MAAKLNIADVDFDLIKSNLKTYLQGQSEFSDFDFEGAGINILLDILAYNTHYQSFYLNMVANEMFLDSSALRQSAVSHAKLIGYTPRSTTSALALVNVAITKSNTDPTTTLTLPRFTEIVYYRVKLRYWIKKYKKSKILKKNYCSSFRVPASISAGR